MLILTRKKDEQVILHVPGLAEPIVITVVELRRRDKVRIAFEAPQSVKIYRKEIDDQIQAGAPPRR